MKPRGDRGLATGGKPRDQAKGDAKAREFAGLGLAGKAGAQAGEKMAAGSGGSAGGILGLRALTDPLLYAERFLKIRTKEGRLAPFVWNAPQRRLFHIIQEQRRQGKPVRIVLLKARQMGFSTLTQALLFHQTATRQNIRSLVMAHKEQAAEHLFSMSRLFFEEMPPALRPMAAKLSAQEMVFENPARRLSERRANPGLRSSLKCVSAGGLGVGRGETFTNVHASEFAFWEGDQRAIFSGLMQAVPPEPGTMVIVESTAGGHNYFKELWDKAEAKTNDFTPVFFSWADLEAYRKDPKGIQPSREEARMMALHSLDLSQIAWRRWCIRNNCGGDEDLFRQEYPICPEEAFLTAGGSVFDRKAVSFQLAQAKRKQAAAGSFLFEERDGKIIDSSIRFDEGAEPFVRIVRKPERQAPYVIGGDTAGEGSDSFVGQVLDNRTGRLVATLRHRFDEDVYARQMYCLGRYYHSALIGIEANFSTYPIRELQRLGYLNQYVRQSFDSYTGTLSESFGFKTTAVTRPVMIAELIRIVREDVSLIEDPETLREMLTFIRSRSGRPEAAAGAHDDCVMALAIAYQIRGQQRMHARTSAVVRHWTEDMIEDYENAGKEEKRLLLRKWGRPH